MNNRGQCNHTKQISRSKILLSRNTDIHKRYDTIQTWESMHQFKSVHI
jgi:hypothetical protein